MKALQAIPIEYGFQNGITILILSTLVVLSVSKVLFPERFSLFVALPVTQRFFSVKRKKYRLSNGFNALLFITSCITVSGFLVVARRTVFGQTAGEPIILFVQLFFSYTLLVLIKYFVEKIIADLFSIEKLIERYLFVKMSFRNYIIILLFLPSCILLNYSSLGGNLFFWIILSIFFIINCLYLFRYYYTSRGMIFRNLFYFILYLCALEIGPYFILYEVITKH